MKITRLVLIAILLLALTVVLASCNEGEEPETEGTAQGTQAVTVRESAGLAFRSNGDGTCTVTGIGTCTDTDLVIPRTSPDGDAVTGVKEKAFSGCTSLKSVTVPESVTSIGAGAFNGCASLESITLPFVGESKNVASSAGKQSFGYIFGTESYTEGAPTNQSYIAYSMKYNTYYVPKTLKTVTVMAGDISYAAFEDCLHLLTINLGEGVTGIGERAFSGCRKLTAIEIPDGVTSVGENAFSYCDKLTSLVIPNSVTSLPKGLLTDCVALKSLTIPFVGGTEKKGKDTYYYTFGYLFGTKKYDGGVLVQQSYYVNEVRNTTEISYYFPKTLTSVTVTGGEIVRHAFYNCSHLTSVTLGDHVTNIGPGAFSNCSGLTAIVIPGSVVRIGNGAFQQCTELTSVTIEKGVTLIDWYAFYHCSKLTSVVIPDGVTDIGVSAFEECPSMTSVTIPGSVTVIEYFAFRDCHQLTTINFRGTKAQWNAIEKQTDWFKPAFSYTVHCTDGDLSK